MHFASGPSNHAIDAIADEEIQPYFDLQKTQPAERSGTQETLSTRRIAP
jgi:hypothetical protein